MCWQYSSWVRSREQHLLLPLGHGRGSLTSAEQRWLHRAAGCEPPFSAQELAGAPCPAVPTCKGGGYCRWDWLKTPVRVVFLRQKGQSLLGRAEDRGTCSPCRSCSCSSVLLNHRGTGDRWIRLVIAKCLHHFVYLLSFTGWSKSKKVLPSSPL